jgi:hypothetical protein
MGILNLSTDSLILLTRLRSYRHFEWLVIGARNSLCCLQNCLTVFEDLPVFLDYHQAQLYENAVAKNDDAAIEFLKHISPVASQHLNIDGLYEFAESIGNISVDNVVEVMSRLLDDAMNPSSTGVKRGKSK